MSIGLYFDHHVPRAIADQLRMLAVIVKDLEVVAKTQDEGEMLSQVHYLPF